MKLSGGLAADGSGPSSAADTVITYPEDGVGAGSSKVAVPIEQKSSGGKKKKAAAEIVLMLGQRKGKKQVTIVYGLDLFGIKLKDATKASKRKFATGSSITTVCSFALPLLSLQAAASFSYLRSLSYANALLSLSLTHTLSVVLFRACVFRRTVR